ncbi:Carboxylic ester hydrolase [Pleurostoma richardsiae]|uniref:Carboxylic ester hydrolase n=1 Tax=Pleurostoma richardsiae TaxID=41990 RepID=A0AA38VUF1_9PEZI|nr:Carboxylic ester hydrolase [Pleurostoma richardsiae]
MRQAVPAFLAPLAFGASAVALVPSAVTVPNGTITGIQCTRANATSFLSIPYAKPPLGELRFAAPQAYDSKYNGNGNLSATAAPPSCPQFGTSLVEDGPQSEDCLFLNVFVPANAQGTSGLPVKVFLHGGGDQTGGTADPLYNGCDLATDAVVVTANYRLGPLGWISLQSANLTGNYGLQDQLLALQWVQDNVAAFGGDATKVLLFGESAGAFNTWAITTLPQAPALMRAAAMESGGGVTFPTIAEAEPWSQQFAQALNCSLTDPACLRSKTPEQLNASAISLLTSTSVPSLNTLITHLGRGAAWGPVIDGTVLPAQPTEVGARVPIIMGSNTQEGALFVLPLYAASIGLLNESTYDEFLTYNFGTLAAKVNETYGLSRFSNTSFPVYYAAVTVMTEYEFRCPTRRGLAASVARGTPAWTYSFGHTPSCPWADAIPDNSAVLALLGPAHSSEIPYVFGAVDGLPRPDGNCSFTDAERAMSRFMVSAWTSMAESGAPGGSWPAFTSNASLGVNFNATYEAGVVDYSMCDFWDAVAREIAQLDANQTESGSSNATANQSTTTSAASAAGS